MLFSKDAIALEYDCDSSYRLKISAAMRYMQQASADHLAGIGLPYDKLYEENMVFLLSKSCIKIFDMPIAGQRIILGTSATTPQGARFIREFAVDDTNGKRMISAVTMWILVDPKTRKILRPSSFPHDLTFQQPETAKDIADIPFPMLPDNKPCAETDVTIRYSHIDCNNHVNNSIYADFVCDSLPIGHLSEKGLDTLILSFHNEAKWGAKINIKATEISRDKYYVHGGKDGNTPCFEALAIIK